MCALLGATLGTALIYSWASLLDWVTPTLNYGKYFRQDSAARKSPTHLCRKPWYLFRGKTKVMLCDRDRTLRASEIRGRCWCDQPKIEASARREKKRGSLPRHHTPLLTRMSHCTAESAPRDRTGQQPARSKARACGAAGTPRPPRQGPPWAGKRGAAAGTTPRRTEEQQCRHTAVCAWEWWPEQTARPGQGTGQAGLRRNSHNPPTLRGRSGGRRPRGEVVGSPTRTPPSLPSARNWALGQGSLAPALL